MKITYSLAASSDGFIATESGDVSWLEELDIAPEETGLAEFFARVDGMIMGRKTYDFVFNYGSWPYESKPCWVVTSREIEPLDGANLFVVDSIEMMLGDLNKRGAQDLWLVGGGQLASALLDEKLLTHVTVSEMPVNLGKGIPIFAEHDFSSLPSSNRRSIEKAGFRQIEVAL